MKLLTFDRMGFLTTEQISPNISMTPEGFLLCAGVAIARTGRQVYSTAELPLDGDADGLIMVERDADAVFDEATLASFEGKPVTIDHPDEFVNPSNWKTLSVGVTQNVRRGDGIADDLLLADLLITDQQAIEAVRGKDLREISCGYEADYEQDAPGKGRQLNIVGNHVALVERGRAGPRCSIKDKELMMKTKDKKPSFLDKLRAFIDGEMEAEKKMTGDGDDDDMPKKTGDADGDDDDMDMKAKTGDSAMLKKIMDKLVSMDSDIQELKEKVGDADGDDDDAMGKKTGDGDDDLEADETKDTVLEAENAETNGEAQGTVLTGDSLKALVARAEILAPGVQVPTGDAAGKPAAIAQFQRKALATAYATVDGKAAIKPFLQGRDIKALTGDALASVFAGASELMRIKNNDRGTRTSAAATRDFGKTATPADINARNAAHWADRK